MKKSHSQNRSPAESQLRAMRRLTHFVMWRQDYRRQRMATGVGWCSGQPVPCGGIHSRESVGSDPVLAPPSSFAFGARGSPSPITSRPGTRAIGAYRNPVRHVHPRLPGFIGYGKAIPGFGPATADASRDHVTTTGVARPTYPLRRGKPRRCLARAQPDRGAGVTDGSGLGLWGARGG